MQVVTGASVATWDAVHDLNMTSIDSCVTPIEMDAGIRLDTDLPTLNAPFACCSKYNAMSCFCKLWIFLFVQLCIQLVGAVVLSIVQLAGVLC